MLKEGVKYSAGNFFAGKYEVLILQHVLLSIHIWNQYSLPVLINANSSRPNGTVVWRRPLKGTKHGKGVNKKYILLVAATKQSSHNSLRHNFIIIWQKVVYPVSISGCIRHAGLYTNINFAYYELNSSFLAAFDVLKNYLPQIGYADSGSALALWLRAKYRKALPLRLLLFWIK